MDHNQASLLDYKEVAKILNSDPARGLSLMEAQDRLRRNGPNKLNINGQANVSDLDGDEYSEIMLENEGCFDAGMTKLVGRISRKVLELLVKYFSQSLLRFFKQFLNPLIQLLIICMIVSALIGEFENSISVGVAVLIVCCISYFQERRADKSLEKLTKQMPSSCKVVRDNRTHELDVERLVVGDVINLSEGQRVPADVRLYDLHSLTVNESNLTGETQCQTKISAPLSKRLSSVLSGQLSLIHDKHYETLGDTMNNNRTKSDTLDGQQQPIVEKEFLFQNLALMGTLVESGHSRGLVIATGSATRYGQVFQMLKTSHQPRSPLQTNIDQLSLHLVVIACMIITAICILGITQNRTALEVAYYAISLAVTAIPEGLPVVVAVIMALGIIRLSKRRTIVKSMMSIETLGCVQILCADKTGTLTRDDMSLTDVVTSELHSLSSSELELLNQEECLKHMTFNKLGGKMYSIGRVMECGTLCNNATIERADNNSNNNDDDDDDNESMGREKAVGKAKARSYKFHGQATECAILDAALRLGFGDSRAKFERLSEIPFNSSTRRMAVQCQRRDLGSAANNGPSMFYVKGAWEEILRDCTHLYECGLVRPKSDEMWLEYARICSALGSQGLRVLALASGPSLDQLAFVGLIGISNSLRDGIVDTVQELREKFHIDFKMITGDSKATALAVARSLGLLAESTGIKASNGQYSATYTIEEQDHYSMSGDQLQKLLNTDIDQMLKAKELLQKTVFYRVDPIQKANIISKLQDLGRIVAMTGDGVNDVISLKRANLSLVMGSGADVCKEIADVILLDDQLDVLRDAVLEGKGIYHKIHSFMTYQISISLALIVMIAVAFGSRCEAPFTVNQLLFINILADGPPAQSLSMEKLGERELSMWPRQVNDPLLNCRLLGQLAILTSILIALNVTLYEYLLELSEDMGAVDGRLDAHSRSLMFSFFVFCTIFMALSLRSKWKTVLETRIYSNWELLACCSLVLILQTAIVQLSGDAQEDTWIGAIFDTECVPWIELFYVFLYASTVLIAMDSIKLFIRFLLYCKQFARKATKNIGQASLEPKLTSVTLRDCP